jgi:hypothetical protein
VKRWVGPALIVAFAGALLLYFYPKSHKLLEDDTDTAVLLSRIVEPHNPFKWFVGDWPLQNHFYRPISSLTYEVDVRLFGVNATELFFTSTLICVVCVLAVFWLAAEMGLKPYAAAAAATLFAYWHMPLYMSWYVIGAIVASMVLVVGLARHRSRASRYLPAVLGIAFFTSELYGPFHREAPSGFYSSVEAWLPGRTATVMCMFALMTMASYIRYEKLRSDPMPEEPLSTDLPATRTSTQASAKRGKAWPFGVLAVIGLALALGSYEQAVMLPIVLILLAMCVRGSGRRPDWQVHGAFFATLVGYFLLRLAILPQHASDYQNSALRLGPGVLVTLWEYAFPAIADLLPWIAMFAVGTAVLFAPGFYAWPVAFLGNVVAYKEALFKHRLALLTWIASIAAIAPMAFLKPFAHYHYWPSAVRSIFVVALFGGITKLTVNAVSLPVVQAPRRPSPAPGSLPRP